MAILSIQSHVVYGCAGNSSAVFPLQRLGREVWALNTVEFSNHTGYGAWTGRALGADLVSDLVRGLEDRGVLPRCEAVLSGYLGDGAVGLSIKDAVQRVKRASPGAVYCCDPVMGDRGPGFYVKPEIPGIFKGELLPLADILTPNHFELEALTGVAAAGLDQTRRALGTLHERGPAVILVTSYQGADTPPGWIDLLASRAGELYRLRTPKLPLGAVAGSGDLIAAVFLSRYLETGDLRRAVELSAASVYGILKATGEAGSGELLTVRAQGELVSPSVSFEARLLPAAG